MKFKIQMLLIALTPFLIGCLVIALAFFVSQQ